jgi:putative membrane protein
MKKYLNFPNILLAIYIVLFIILGISPYKRDVWFVENMTVVVVVVALIVLYRRGIRFSNLSYALMSVFIFMHTIGGHYTFERVPFEFVTDLLGLGRNNYDRIAHFSVGFYAFPLIEILLARGLVTKRWLAALFGIFAIGAVAALYEIFEWIYAILSDPEAGIAVLGSQGDIWDAQKDMLADTLGAISAVILFLIICKNSKENQEISRKN